MSQPSLRALLLTDVVDSTKLTECLGDAAMAELWTAHDRAARDLLPAWHGREIDKTDGMLLLFDAAVDALGYALAYHRALKALALPFTARAGIHVGPVMLRANTADDIARGAKPVEVDGIALPVTARVMSIALGGQTLLSADARLALGVTPSRVQSHGNWRLHGVAEPVELFEIGDADAPFVAPPDAAKAYRVVRQGELWVPVRDVRHNLPAERDSFVGRQEPLQQLAQKLDDGARLVSVLGIGGTGKTRLVTRFAWSWLGDFPGGVWFCDLSQARSVDGIYFAVAQGLDVPLGKTDPVVQLAHAIHGRGKCLVILDNFEQVARHAEETLGRWLDRAAQARFIVTTREVLGIVGEETMALAPLPPSDAATLFLRRAQAARQGYRPSADDLAAIDQLAKVLDGLPLAIELAAARVRVMTPRTLLGRMNERFKLLWSSGGRQDRQATLRAAFDWSWELLSEPEKSALAQLSVFEGGFTLEAAEAVLNLSATGEAPWVVDVVQWLVDKSFVRRVSDERFDLLESVKDYAAEHLRTPDRFFNSGKAFEFACLARHWRHYANGVGHVGRSRKSDDANNVVAACRRSIASADTASATRCLERAWDVVRTTGPFRVAYELANSFVNAGCILEPRELAWAHWVAGSALDMLGEVASARENFDEGLKRCSLAVDPRCHAQLQLSIGCQLTFDGDLAQAFERLVLARRIARGIADQHIEAMAFNALGRLAEHQSNFDEARNLYEQALELAHSLDDRRLAGGYMANLGGLHHDLGHLSAAQEHYEQALAIAQEFGDSRWEANTRCNLGLLHHDRGAPKAAKEELQLAQRAAQQMGHVRLHSIVLCNLGIVLAADGHLAEANSTFEASIELAQELADRRSEGQFRGHLAVVQQRLGMDEQARVNLTIGEQLLSDMADRLSFALLLSQKSEVALQMGNVDTGFGSFEAALEIAKQMGAARDSPLMKRLDCLRTTLASLEIPTSI